MQVANATARAILLTRKLPVQREQLAERCDQIVKIERTRVAATGANDW